jgi:hypothetical protein
MPGHCDPASILLPAEGCRGGLYATSGDQRDPSSQMDSLHGIFPSKSGTISRKPLHGSFLPGL